MEVRRAHLWPTYKQQRGIPVVRPAALRTVLSQLGFQSLRVSQWWGVLSSLHRWLQGRQSAGGRNTLGALRLALEGDPHRAPAVPHGLYLFTSGVPDQDMVSFSSRGKHLSLWLFFFFHFQVIHSFFFFSWIHCGHVIMADLNLSSSPCCVIASSNKLV